MKKTLIKTLLCSLVLLFASCALIPIGTLEQEVSFGYPENVTFSDKGGEIVFGGDNFYEAIIFSSKDPKQRGYWGYNEADSTEYYVFDWLKVEYKKSMCLDAIVYANELKIIAEPNTTCKPRKLSIEIPLSPYYISQPIYIIQTITVKQEK